MPIIDGGQRDHYYQSRQVLRVEDEMLFPHQVPQVPRNQATRLLLLHALETLLQLVVRVGLLLQLGLDSSNLDVTITHEIFIFLAILVPYLFCYDFLEALQ